MIMDKCKKKDKLLEKFRQHRYEKSKLLELRKNQKCQEWPKVLNKKFIGMDGKWDPVGAFEGSTYPSRTHSRDGIQHFYNERYRKRQRDDHKYNYYGESSKRYSSSYGINYPRYYSSHSNQRYNYEDDIVYESSRSRASPDYYASYSSQSTKPRNGNDNDPEERAVIDSKPEWFTGGPSNINETIELSGMSRELEAGILKNRKPSRRTEENFPQTKMSSPKTDSNASFSKISSDNNNDLDSHLLKIIKDNAKENDKRKTMTTAKEVEKVLKSILLRPNDECQEAASLTQNLHGVMKTVNEIEAKLKLKGNQGAGDMSAYYKLLGLVQTGNDTQTNHTETSSNNNHPRQIPVAKYPPPNSTNISKTFPTPDVDLSCGQSDTIIGENFETDEKNIIDESCADFEKQSVPTTEIVPPKVDDTSAMETKKINGYNNYNTMNSSNNLLRNERLAMASRNMCNTISSQFSNHMLGTGQMGQNAYRWIRAMNNAAAASARITQMSQQEYCLASENNNANWDSKPENKQDGESCAPSPDMNAIDALNGNFDGNTRANSEQTNGMNHINNYLNSFNLNNYVNGGSSLMNQFSMKPFLPFGYHSQASMFGRQYLNPYLLQQLFVQKQWENRNFSLQNQLRQFQSMNFSSQENLNSTVNNQIHNSTSTNQGE